MSKAVSTIQQDPTTVTIPGVDTITPASVKREWDKATIQSRIQQVQTAGSALAKAGEPVMMVQALTLVNMKDYSKVIGKGDGALFASDELAQISLGITTKSYGTRLLRLGRAMVRHGVRKGSEDYKFLYRHADAGYFGDVLGKATPVSDDEFRATLKSAKALYAKAGGTGSFPSAAAVKALTVGNDGKPNDGTDPEGSEGSDDKATTAKATTPEGPTTKGDWQALVRGMESHLRKADDTLATEVHAMLVNLVKGDVDRRKVLADKARVNGATPKAPRKPRTPKVQEQETTPETTPEVEAVQETTPEVESTPEA